jgi:hypothetical protein
MRRNPGENKDRRTPTGIVYRRGTLSMKPHTGALNLAYGSFESTCTMNLSWAKTKLLKTAFKTILEKRRVTI